MQTESSFIPVISSYRYLMIAGSFIAAGSACAAILTDTNGTPDFGWALGLATDSQIVGAPGGTQPGVAYYYTDGTVLTLQKENGGSEAANNYFGYAVGASGNGALVGDFADRAGSSNIQVGAAYYYKDLGSKATGADQTVTETLKLQASDGTRNAYFGRAVSLSEDNALVGAFGDQHDATQKYVGAAYYFRNLDNAVAGVGGVVTETLKLVSDRAADQNSYFGMSLSLSGDNALVSALGANQSRGEAYYYRDLANATPSAENTVKETFVLRASDGAASDMFGRVVSLDGNAALVGANGSAGNRGAAYYYKDLDQAGAGTVVNETAKLTASNGQAGDNFGFHASLSGDNALVGARSNDAHTGAVYWYKELSQAATGSTVTENIMLTASDGKAGDLFGSSVALNANRFSIGANRAGGSGRVYTGDIRTFSVLDAGNTKLSTGGLSFVSKDDWVIGATTSGNSVTVSRDDVTGIADIANVTADDKSVYIGKLAGANNNELRIEGTLLANQVFVGAAGNSGNVLFVGASASVGAESIHLGLGNSIALYGMLLDYSDLFNWLALSPDTSLFANGTGVNLGNAEELLRISTTDGYTLYTAVPEPSTYAALFGVAMTGIALIRLRKRTSNKARKGA